MSTSGGSPGGGGLSSATVTLNTAAIKALFPTPTTIVAAPGAGKMLVVLAGTAQLKPIASTLGGVDSSQGFYYGTSPVATQRASGRTVPDLVNQAAALAQAVANYVPAAGILPTASGLVIAQANIANQPITYGAEIDGGATYDIGPIVTTAIASGGTGYAVGDTGTIDADIFTGGAAYVVDTVAAITGAVTALHFSAVGDGYTTGNNPLSTTAGGAQPGIGTGLTIDVLSVVPFAANLYVTLYYTTLTLT